jgi:predicted N-formylglutamate amidohydrolase
LRARDVRAKLIGHNVPQQLMAVLEEIAEDQMAERQQIMQLASMLDRVMENMTAVMVVAGNMKDRADELQGMNATKRMKGITADEDN